MKTNRSLSDELKQGINEIQAHKDGKMTLRTHAIVMKPHEKVDAELIRNTRESLSMSRSLFVLKLRVCHRVLGQWKQGKTV